MTDGPRRPFSASDAALDGFRVIGLHWRLMVGWVAFNILALVALVTVTVIVLLALNASGSPALANLAGGVMGGLGMLTIQMMIVTALYRTLLRAEEPGFLHLRVGLDEARMLLPTLGMAVALTSLFGVGWAFTAWVQREFGTPLAFVAGIGSSVGLVWLHLRLSLSAPVTFVTHRLGFAGSWRLTKGRLVPLLGMTVLAVCLLALVAVAAWFALYLLVGSASGFRDLGLLNEESFADRPFAYLVQTVGEIVIWPLFLTLSQAPFIAAYKAFKDDI